MVYKQPQFEGYEDGLLGRSATDSESNSTIESRNSTEEGDVSPATISGDRASRSLISRKVFYGLMNEKLKL